MSGGDGSDLSVDIDGAGAIDPSSGDVTASAPVGSNPSGITAGAGRIWVTNGADGTVTRIDPATGHVDQTLDVGTSPAGVTVGAGAVWVANALDGTVSRIEPSAGRVVQTIRIGGRPTDLAFGHDAIWVADSDRDAVFELDSRSGVPQRRIPLPAAPGGVAVGFGSLWVTEPLAHRVLRIDPRRGHTQAEVGLGGGAGPIAIGAGAVWVVNTLDGTLSRVDPTRNAVSSTVPVGSAPRDVAAGFAGVWVADEGGRARSGGSGDRRRAPRVRRRRGARQRCACRETPWVIAGAPVGAEHRGGTLRVSYSEFEHLDPAEPFDVHPSIWRATGDGLVAVASGPGIPQVVPDLAVTVPEPTDGGRTYSFQLRPELATPPVSRFGRRTSGASSSASTRSAARSSISTRPCEGPRGVSSDRRRATSRAAWSPTIEPALWFFT